MSIPFSQFPATPLTVNWRVEQDGLVKDGNREIPIFLPGLTLHALSFFLSPSIWALFCRYFMQQQCVRPRDFDTHTPRSLGVWLGLITVINAFSVYPHATEGASQGRTVILDFIGLNYVPSKLQLLSLDLFIMCLQMLLVFIAYEIHVIENTNSVDTLLPIPSPSDSPTLPLSTSAAESFDAPEPSKARTSTSCPHVMEITFSQFLRRLRETPPNNQTNRRDGLPMPNLTPWSLRMRAMRTRTRIDLEERRDEEAAPGTRTVPGSIDNGHVDESLSSAPRDDVEVFRPWSLRSFLVAYQITSVAVCFGPSASAMLDNLVLIACVCIGIASIIYIFYWSRLVAWLLGLVIRFLSWSQGASSIWVSIGSIHFSLLSGRILLKDIRYHSSNQTVKIVKCQIVWRYWVRKPLLEDGVSSALGSEERFEWFLYNRTAAYENIISQMASKSSAYRKTRRSSTECRQSFQTDFGTPIPPPSSVLGALHLRTPTFLQDAFTWFKRQLPTLDPKELLPIGLDATKGVIICGNNSTPNLLVVEFQKAEGNLGVSQARIDSDIVLGFYLTIHIQSRSKYDLYKQYLTLRFQNVLIQYTENKQYGDTMPAMGEMISDRVQQHVNLGLSSSYMTFHRFGKIWRKLRLYVLMAKFILRQSSSRPQSRAKSTSVDEDTPIGPDFTSMEYAIEQKILETPSLELCYYADVAGTVPPFSQHPDQGGLDDIGNGDIGPEWGIDLVIKGGFICYGPWADRQRGHLQRVFFPPTFHDAEETLRLQPGDQRLWTNMRIFVELRDATTLHVPFREASKNWQWDGLTEVPSRPKKREPAVIRFTAGDSSTVNYMMPMIASSRGYEPTLEVHIDTLVVTSSLNDIELVTSESCRVRCELPSPLKWNGSRTWDIAVTLRKPILYLLRDHITMLIDLGKDWASGPPSDFFRFVPTVYSFQLEMHHFELNLYANDHNIIDKPLIKEENAILTIRGPSLRNVTTIPSDIFRPEATTIAFCVEAPNASLTLSLPRWHTHALHAPEDGSHIGVLDLQLDGSYRYFADVRENNVEQLKLVFLIRNVAYKVVGWSIRYFMIIKDNYFGSFTHFSTLYEYLERKGLGLPPGDPVMDKYRKGHANMLQVDIFVRMDHGCVILPAGLPGYDRSCTIRSGSDEVRIGPCLVLHIPELQLQLRMHDYFMDLSLNVGTITGYIDSNYPEKVLYTSQPKAPNVKSVLLIEGLDITANRLFGPVPRTITYFCVWEIKVGSIKGILSAAEASTITDAITSFRVNFSDIANAPAVEYALPSYPDVTFVKVRLSSVHVTWKAGDAAAIISLPEGLRLDNNNLGGRFHRQLTSIRVPVASVKMLLHSLSNRWLEAGETTLDAYIDIYTSPVNWKNLAAAQESFVTEQDDLTGRAAKMMEQFRPSDIGDSSHTFPAHRNGVCIPQPLSRSRERRMHRPSWGDNAYRRKNASIWPDSRPLSESEEELAVSEADRDARLAQSRVDSLMSPVREEDQDMSDGDESDNEDLTDGESSDSDWFELEEGTSDPLCRQYGRFLRHYAAKFIDTLELWDQSPFVSINSFKAEAAPKYARPRAPRSSSIHPNVFPDMILPPLDVDVVVNRCVCRKGVEIRVTPLVLPVLSQLEEDCEKSKPNPELCIDSMMSGYLGSFSSKSRKYQKRILLDVAVPSLRLLVLRHLDHPSSNPTGIMGSIDLRLAGFYARGFVQRRIETWTTGFDSLGVTLDTIGRVQKMEKVFATISTSDVDIHWDGKHLEAEFGSPGCERLSSVPRAEDTIMDPLSAIQPLYLIQSGIPHQLRTDATFRFLFHLRNHLWYLQNERWLGLPDSDRCMKLEDIVPDLEARLTIIDPEAYQTQHLALLEPLFPSLRKFSVAIDTKRLGRAFTSFTIRILHACAQVEDPENSNSSGVSVRNLLLAAKVRYLNLINPPRSPSESDSDVSIEQYSPDLIQAFYTRFSLDATVVTIYPHVVGFMQAVLRVRRMQKSFGTRDRGDEETRSRRSKASVKRSVATTKIEVDAFVQSFRVQAIAANLTFEYGLNSLRYNSNMMFDSSQNISTNHSLLFTDIYIRARSPSESSMENDQDVLAALTLNGGRLNTITRQENTSAMKVRLIFAADKLNFTVPRSALRLYRFFQEWRNDFVVGIESSIRELLAELRSSGRPTPVEPPPSYASILFQINGHLGAFGVLLQVMHGTWLSWEMNDTTMHMSTTPLLSSHRLFGLQMGSQIFTVSSKSDARDILPNSRVKLELPSLSLTGRFDGACVRAILLAEFLELKVKPSHWDTLMAVQQKFGQDFNDLLALVQETRLKQSHSAPREPIASTSPTKFVIAVKMNGFRIGLEGLSSTVYLECKDINGGLDDLSGRAWFMTLSGLALSLAPLTSLEPHSTSFSRDHRSAFVTIDFKVVSRSQTDQTSLGDMLQISVTKIHAVMQPSSIGEIGDFIDEMQAEMSVRREQRAHELAAFKQKTQSILKSFDVKVHDLEVRSSWLDNYSIDVNVNHIGVAFPLTHDEQLQLPKSGSHDSSAVRAFLFSIESLKFGTERGVTGEAHMKNCSFQFVQSFHQSLAGDFSGSSHQTRNRLVYPEMTAYVRSSGSETSRQITLKANVSGFILDLDSNIPDYIFSLVDVYRQGEERVAQLSNSSQRLSPSSPSRLDAAKESFERRSTAIPTSAFCGSLTFLSGKVRAYSATASKLSRAKAFTKGPYNPTDEQVLGLGAEIFRLPVVSVWTEYRATPTSQKLPTTTGDTEASILVFKSTVHSSQNTLRPTLLPFLTELIGRIESRLRESSRRETLSPTSSSLVAPRPATYDTNSSSSMQISFSLRIDQSRLELTCKPDVNVIAGLHWDSGGFVVNVSPRAHNVTFTGTVGGLTVGLRHGFLTEDCVNLDARNLAFSVTFSKLNVDETRSISSVSLVLDTEFLGGVRFSRLQDVLCFKAVWLDRLPMFNGKPSDDIVNAAPKSNPDTPVTAHRQEYVTIILLRIRQIKLDVDLGQSISTVILDLKDSILRTKLTEATHELSLSVGDVIVTAKGNVAGKANVSNCVFQTIRRIENHIDDAAHSRMLELRMTSGPFVVVLESEHQRLLHYRAEPIEIEVFDDWSQILSHSEAYNRPLSLSFTVVSPEIVAVITVGTIPKILAYAKKFNANLDAQQEGASRDSKTFSASRTTQPNNALSAVAEAMLHTARNRLSEVEAGISYIIRQHMSLRLDLLRLVLFPRTMDDLEAAQFIGRNIRARLDRLIQADKPSKRDIFLSFTSMSISRFTQLADNNEWLTGLLKDASEATIVGLPSMTMHMVSKEMQEGSNKVLDYDFRSVFVRRTGMRDFEDIYITLNVGLYSWLTVQRKNLTREMDQVRTAAEWRSTLTAPVNIASTRRKVVDTPDVPRSATVPRPARSPSPSTAARSASAATPSFAPPLNVQSTSAPLTADEDVDTSAAVSLPRAPHKEIIYRHHDRFIERLTMRQLGDATPDVMHPFFMKKAGFSLEDSLPQYVHEYATAPLEQIMEALLKLYSRQLLDRGDSV
ncbi:uncharacterized protein EV420DRAFT_1746434 [Desarmillaria tabescens]|uniref:DUF1746 domain-containing protein n=1 Tax=Armillaria tabescens TaxID=1929756 RepID=A0AA39TJ95_ARMTA|nr:uncharacterized protein EV420DRAFT_1746434 [Desarmillaria tabescens]KAK0460992.1 hypothetical protein EV420DRAFT_1746434 [Desarmillaria tabescens]